MSLPLKRRIARAALLVAAAAPAIGMGVGSAQAAEPLRATELSGLTGLDNTTVDHAVQGTSQDVNALATRAAGPTVARALPVAGRTAGNAGRILDPIARRTANDGGGTAGRVLGKATRTVQGRSGLPATDLGNALQLGD